MAVPSDTSTVAGSMRPVRVWVASLVARVNAATSAAASTFFGSGMGRSNRLPCLTIVDSLARLARGAPPLRCDEKRAKRGTTRTARSPRARVGTGEPGLMDEGLMDEAGQPL